LKVKWGKIMSKPNGSFLQDSRLDRLYENAIRTYDSNPPHHERISDLPLDMRDFWSLS